MLSYVIHATRLRWRGYARLQTETNAAGRVLGGDRLMTNIRHLDPSASPLDYYGSELRRLREAAGLTQEALGGIIFVTGSLVGQIETAHKVPTRDFSERVDAGLGTDGMFSRLVGM